MAEVGPLGLEAFAMGMHYTGGIVLCFLSQNWDFCTLRTPALSTRHIQGMKQPQPPPKSSAPPKHKQCPRGAGRTRLHSKGAFEREITISSASPAPLAFPPPPFQF